MVLPTLLVVALHLGALHPVEQALTLVLAFGPFALLGLVIWVRRRQDAREDAREAAAQAEPEQTGQRER